MNHIYIHIPFCLKKCAYCSFCSISDLSLINDYLESLMHEINIYAQKYPNEKIETIYIGGGTPSVLTPEQLSLVVDAININFVTDCCREFTLEANPETIDEEKLLSYKKIGVNRLSLGIQSFNDRDLTYLGRIHAASTARMAINHACSVFDNVNVDIIYALPRQNEHNLAKNLNEALSFPVTHISCYELTYEKGTPLHNDMKNKNERDLELYQYTKFLLETAGFAQYEISNYSKPGFECAHNLAYWSNESYLGFGASAHSYDKEKKARWANTKVLNKYLNKEFIDFKESAQDIDILIMGLRKNKGLPLVSIPEKFSQKTKLFIAQGLLQLNEGYLSYTEKGKLIENKILTDFITD